MSNQPAVVVDDLRKAYGDVAAVDGLSFEIHQGETFSLLGPNGAGKSTTIEILEGFRRRTGGRVSVLGTDPAHGGSDWRARLGIVLQDLPEGGAYTVREQLRQNALYYPHPRDVEEVIAAVGLEKKADVRIGKLSGGQRRRVDVALGVIGRPDLLFLDEPTTGFDPEARREFWDLIRSLSAEGTTILLTTHYLDEAAQLADRVGIIVNGKLAEIGRVDEIGGQAARQPRVTWREQDGELRTRQTEQSAQLVGELVSRLGAEPRDLSITRPTLEDVYLDLVSPVAAARPTPTTAVTEAAR